LVLSLSSTSNEPNEFLLEGLSDELPELLELGCSGALTAKVKSVPTLTHLMMDLAVRGSITLDCGRCLDKLTGTFAVKLKLLVEKKDAQGLEWEEDEGLAIEEYLVKIGPDIQEIPLEHLIAEQIILNYNLNPLPSLDEKDRCIQCNRQAYVAEAARRDKDKVDPRWEKLQALKKPELDKPEKENPGQSKPKPKGP
jgi:uncharacterized metal-binding protein YceD (DUF177 family)